LRRDRDVSRYMPEGHAEPCVTCKLIGQMLVGL